MALRTFPTLISTLLCSAPNVILSVNFVVWNYIFSNPNPISYSAGVFLANQIRFYKRQQLTTEQIKSPWWVAVESNHAPLSYQESVLTDELATQNTYVLYYIQAKLKRKRLYWGENKARKPGCTVFHT